MAEEKKEEKDEVKTDRWVRSKWCNKGGFFCGEGKDDGAAQESTRASMA
jgi:hypothetical protein